MLVQMFKCSKNKMKGEAMNKKDTLNKCGHCGREHSNDSIKKTREFLPDENMLYELSDFFKIFGDSTRIKILVALDREPLCVGEISEVLSMTNSAVSHQLKVLRQGNLIKSERRGKNVYYALADSHVRDIIEKALEHLEE